LQADRPNGDGAQRHFFAGLVSSTVAIPLAMAFGMVAFVTLATNISALGRELNVRIRYANMTMLQLES
jgi:hypothetical protein